uniref:D-arabinono-1,4-lactone oxidase n=1 Tax=Blastobotrys adeninivorans TaxID=409370 RepID=A0A060T4P9_BLAAD
MNSAVKGYVHRTWAGTFKCKPERFLQPSTLDEIRQIVLQARQKNKTVMLTGSGHSPSHMTMTDQWLVNLDRFNKVVKVNRHKSGKFTDVTVEAGMRVYQLNKFLASEGLSIQSLGSISDQSMAGVISTGTHGSSAYHGLVSQQIVDLSIMTGSGEVIKCSTTEHSDMFRAGMLSLGKLGIITEVTIRAVPVYTLETVFEVVPFDRFMNELWDTVWLSQEYVRVWWFPYARQVVLCRGQKSQKPADENTSSYFENPIRRFLYQAALLFAVKVMPSVTPLIERLAFKLQYGYKDTYDKTEPVVFECVRGHNMDCLFSQFVNEWAMPLTEGKRVLRELEQVIDKAAETGEFYAHSPFEVRIANTTGTGKPVDLDNIPEFGAIPGNELKPLLDPTPKLPYASGEGKVTYDSITLYLNATMYRPFGIDCPVDKWYQKFESIVGPAGGKPHWAKNFLGSQGSSTKDGQMRGLQGVIKQWYGDDLDVWKKIRKQNDPTGIFLPPNNDWAKINGLVD